MQPDADIDEIYLSAVELPPGEPRSAYLDQVCAGHPELRRRVERYLQAQPGLGSFLEAPAVGLGANLSLQPSLSEAGTSIGLYKLRELLGEGGFGLVYVAEQEQPIRRKVALKVIKPGMDSKEVIARFETERQALALMDHPNIAKVIDAGTTETGRPYFVMELVRGLSITDYCDQAKLSLRERLQLFITVCQAVQHAHQKGIIHRDLKPPNVMITLHDGTPVPKIIDFGVAKALNQRLTDQTLYTRHAQMLGTPMYMSPEQAELSGLDVDTRSDVYSLGVLLYELLTGQTPFDKEAFSKLGYDELRRMVREVEPPRPSARVSTLAGEHRSTVATRRGIDERQHSRNLQGELDWIVMKALEKDRTRRYGGADALAADLRRYLDDQPVQACPPSLAYRLRKFAWRKRAMIGASLLATVSVILATALVVDVQNRAGHEATQGSAATGNSATATLSQPPLARAPDRTLPGLVPDPPLIPDVGRWQLITKKPRGLIRSAVWSPDETQVALAEANHVRFYDTRDLKLMHVLVAHSLPVRSVAWHPAGDRLVSCSEDGTVRLWTSSGRPTHLMEGHTGPVYQVAWRPDGTQLASCGADGTVRLWGDNGVLIDTLDEGDRHVFGIDWSPDGQVLASVGGDIEPAGPDGDAGDNALRLWNPDTGKLIHKIPSSVAYSGLCVDWHPDGQQLAVGYGHVYRQMDGQRRPLPDAGIRLWNIDGTPGATVADERDSISTLAWRPDGGQIAFSGRWGKVWIWDADTQKSVDSGIERKIDVFSLNWNRDGSGLLVTSRSVVREWNGQSTTETLVPVTGNSDGGFYRVFWSPDGTIVAADRDGRGGDARFWSSEGAPVPNPEPPTDRARAWWERDNPKQRPDGTPAPTLEDAPPPASHTRYSWSQDGWLAAASWYDHSVRIWNNQGKLIKKCLEHRGGVDSVAWSPDGTQLVSGGGDSVRIWNRDGTPGHVMTDHTDEVYGVAWSPDGKWIASGSSDSTIRLWKSDGTAARVLYGHQGGVYSVAFSPDSKKLVSSSWLDNTLRVWDIETGTTEWQAVRLDEKTTITLISSGFPVGGDTDDLDALLLYALERNDGTTELITPNEFWKRHGVHLRSQLAQGLAKSLEAHQLNQAERLLGEAFTTYADVDQNAQAAIAEMAHQLANASYFEKDYARAERTIRMAIDVLEQVVAETPEDDSLQRVLCSQWTELGMFLSAKGRNSDALREISRAVHHMQEALALHPDESKRPLCWSLWMRALRQTTLEAALDDLDQILQLDPNYDRFAWDLVYFLDDLVDAPRDSTPEATREVPVELQFEIAKGVFLEVIKRRPSLPDQQILAGWLASAPQRFRDPHLALQLARRSVEVGQKSGKDLDCEETVAWAQFRLGDFEGCLATLDAFAGDKAASDFICAMVYQRLGRAEEARSALKRADEWSKGQLQSAFANRWKSGLSWEPTPDMIRRLQAEAAAALEDAATPESAALSCPR